MVGRPITARGPIDEARLYPDYSAHNLHLDWQTMPIFKSGFAFVGKGHIVGAQLCDGTAGGSILKIYDTDDLAFSESMIKESLAAGSAQVAYSQPIGTAPFLFQVHRAATSS